MSFHPLPVDVRARHVQEGTPPERALTPALAELDEALLGSQGASRALASWRAELVGLGPLEQLAADPSVTDILVNGDGRVWVDRGCGVHLTDATVGSAKDLRRLATRLAGLAGRRLDDSQPWVDAELGDGIRLHAVLPPLVATGAHLSLRLARRSGWDLATLDARGMFAPGVLELLGELVRCRLCFLVTGGTGTGKTALLGALLSASSPQDRVVVVEDVRELLVAHPHVVSLQGRSANVEGVGSVTLVDLVRQALRMRPDRLVVGEVRGAEIRELLAALNTGHEGGCGTLHANRAADVPARVSALGALAGLSPDAAAAQFSSAVHAIVHLRRRGGMREVSEVGVVDGGAVQAVLAVDARGVHTTGPGAATLRRLFAESGR